jgi:hypothetical protein
MSLSAKLCLFLSVGAVALAQRYSQRGFLDTRLTLYPQTGSNDSGLAAAESVLRYEASSQITPNWQFNGALELRTDTHRQTERSLRLDWQDRSLPRPALSLRRLSATYHRGPFNLELGKQFIRWGKADILNPTDRFAPRDFLNVVNTDFLAVTAARLTWERGPDSLDFVFTPRLTPSRIPLFNQRWVVLPELPLAPAIGAGLARYPGGPQFGARHNHVGSGYEYSVSFFEGFNHLPLLAPELQIFPFRVNLGRVFPKLRMYGGDAALPLRWFTVKAEGAWFQSPQKTADEYALYVIQLERQAGEWLFIGGYAGQVVTEQRRPLDFAPDRGIARTFLGRASYTIDANRSLAAETAVRQNGEGAYVKFEYSQLFGQHWRATAGFALLRGDAEDFLGQYRRNSHGILSLRYNF